MQRSSLLVKYYQSLPGIASKGKATIGFALNPSSEQVSALTGESIHLIVDSNVASCPVTSKLFANNQRITVTSLRGGEGLKDDVHMNVIIDDINAANSGCIAIVGGGSLINVANYAVSKLINLKRCDRAALRLVIVPTNTMSIADVAYGSLGLINDKDKGTKNAFREVIDPDNIFLVDGYIKYGDAGMQKEGLVETLKHCLLQDTDGVKVVLDTLTSRRFVCSDIFDCAVWGLKLKADVVRAEYAGELTNIGLAKSYGHLHATAIEEFYGFNVIHADCVLVGLMLDLALSEQNNVAQTIIAKLGNEVLCRLLNICEDLAYDKLKELYNEARKFRVGDNLYEIIKLNDVGEYDLTDLSLTNLRTIIVPWDMIEAELRKLNSNLASAYG